MSLVPELDRLAVAEVESELAEMEETARTLILDLEATTFIDAAGIRLLVEATRRIERRGGRVVVANASSMLRRIFVLTDVDQTLTLVNNP